MALEVGSRLGHYDVTAKIGEGSMGAVYRARDTKLDRDVALKLLLLLGLGICACGGDTTTADVTDDESVARRIHDRVITIDTHDDIPFNFATREVDPGIRANRQVDLPKMREGGLDVGSFIVYVGQGQNNPEGYAQAYEQAITKFEAIHRMANEMYPDQIEVAYTADDVERIYNDGKLVAAIGIENGWPVGESLANVATFHELGGRYITLAHKRPQPDRRLGKPTSRRAGRVTSRHQRLRRRSDCRDEPSRDHGRCLAHLKKRDARSDRAVRGPGNRIAFKLSGTLRRAAQPG